LLLLQIRPVHTSTLPFRFVWSALEHVTDTIASAGSLAGSFSPLWSSTRNLRIPICVNRKNESLRGEAKRELSIPGPIAWTRAVNLTCTPIGRVNWGVREIFTVQGASVGSRQVYDCVVAFEQPLGGFHRANRSRVQSEQTLGGCIEQPLRRQCRRISWNCKQATLRRMSPRSACFLLRRSDQSMTRKTAWCFDF